MRHSYAVLPLLMFAAQARAQDHMQHMDHSMHDMGEEAMPSGSPAPEPPTDHAADAYFGGAEMAQARVALRREAGGMSFSKLMIDQLEVRTGKGADGYAWDMEGWFGGDIDRLAIKSEGEGAFGESAEQIEVQAGWLHAIDPWFNIRAGIRQDMPKGANRTHAALAIEGLAPYWFEVEGQLFLSNKGDVTARMEASYDQRITQRLILQPDIEINASAQEIAELGQGSGLTSIELGTRLRYEIAPEFAPYVGVNWERKLGGTARHARMAGEDAGSTRLVLGVRIWF